MSGDEFVDEQAAAEAERKRSRQHYDGWFAGQLGDDWVSDGTGIYYPPGAPLPQALEPERLDEALRDAVRDDAPKADDDAAEAETARRAFWRR